MTFPGKRPDWWFDELRHAGPEHATPKQVAVYDARAGFDPLPDLERLRRFGLDEASILVDLGAGTGTFALAAAEVCQQVVAVDISPAMLALTAQSAAQRGLGNIRCIEAGFLTYRHEGAPADFVYSRNVLHHLPDFWKVEALARVAAVLKPTGIFRLQDLTYTFAPQESEAALDNWILSRPEAPAPGWTRQDLRAHVRDEFSTYDWLLEAILDKVGFDVLEKTVGQVGVYTGYVCRRR